LNAKNSLELDIKALKREHVAKLQTEEYCHYDEIQRVKEQHEQRSKRLLTLHKNGKNCNQHHMVKECILENRKI